MSAGASGSEGGSSFCSSLGPAGWEVLAGLLCAGKEAEVAEPSVEKEEWLLRMSGLRVNART